MTESHEIITERLRKAEEDGLGVDRMQKSLYALESEILDLNKTIASLRADNARLLEGLWHFVAVAAEPDCPRCQRARVALEAKP